MNHLRTRAIRGAQFQSLNDFDAVFTPWVAAIPIGKFNWPVKFFLTDGQVFRLLCIGGRCNLFTVRSIQSTE